jgi:hypothetical protein
MPDSGSPPRVVRAVREIENLWIELGDGTRLAARVWQPVDAERKPVPAILEYLPYRKRDGTTVRDALTHPWFAAQGYACLRVDLRGNGESDGLMTDEYTPQELADAVEVIAWIARQPWCTGKVGMMGISWGGFNALQVAALRPPALAAIVSLCSTDDRYADDIHYKGGCLLAENLGWSSTMFCYSSRPPDPALVGERWRQLWLQRLENLPNLVETWLAHQTRDSYWRHGSVCEDYGAIAAATQLWGGWSDAYHNAVPRMLANLEAPRQGIIGPWLHKYPHFAVPGPAVGFLQEALRWWDRWLKGLDSGVERDPMLRVFVEDWDPPAARHAVRSGRWVAEAVWPSPSIRPHLRYLTVEGLAAAPAPETPLPLASPLDTGTAGGEYCQIWLGAEGPFDQRRDDAGSLCFDSAPLAEPLEILGSPVVELELSSDKPVAQLTARLNELGPDGASLRVSYGVLNLCHRESHAEPAALEPGRRYRVRLQLDDCAHRFATGHRLRLALSTAYWPMVWPAPAAAQLTVYAGAATLTLPQRRGGPDASLPPPAAAPPAERRELRAPSNARHLVQDIGKGEVRVEITDDFGAAEIPPHGLEVGMVARETWSLRPEQPLSARGETHWTMTMGRGDWRVRTETRASLTGDASDFQVEGSLEAYEGRGPAERLVLRRQFKKSLRRGFI